MQGTTGSGEIVKELEIVESVMIDCPLLKRKIATGYCYEIVSVVSKMVKPDILDDEIDRDKAYEICCKCELNQMRNTRL